METFGELQRAIGRIEARLDHIHDIVERVEKAVEQSIEANKATDERLEAHENRVFRVTVGAATVMSALSALGGALLGTKFGKLISQLFA